ncbi:GGDEF domain-containing protein [Rhizorhabdus sp.]|uniref:GGDEF domain-containing protein n=1 Tax=Rhizorhabdus sp. TaxID=1968843 RepID=UPI001B476F52|nr:GGDEF domain-containing protein [Rhizorhabdus sp.]MBP8231373.1 GGDEF domain-containing protein [Rhizorhabdus sp.]
MSAAVVNVITLFFVSTLLAGMMLIAWRSFGRPAHVLIWALAYSAASIEWICNIYLRFGGVSTQPFLGFVYGLCCLANGLLAAGCYIRLKPEARRLPPLLAAGVAAALIGTIVAIDDHQALRDILWLSFAGSMLLICAACVAHPLGRASLPERAVAAMFLLFALVDFCLALMAPGQGAHGEGAGHALFRTVLVIAYPLAFTGVGLFTVFLVATDLAESMRRLATSDQLTGILNRRGFEEAAERAIVNAQRQQAPLALVLADIDNFKAINDRHGHAVGDCALKHFAQRLERLVRRGDLVGRVGGEEFALLLMNTRDANALEVVEHVRLDIASVPVNGAGPLMMTASFGVTGIRPGDTSLAQLLMRADRALYRSKLDGRDRITHADELEEARAILHERV